MAFKVNRKLRSLGFENCKEKTKKIESKNTRVKNLEVSEYE